MHVLLLSTECETIIIEVNTSMRLPYQVIYPTTLDDFFRMSRTSFQLLFQHLAGCSELRPRQYQCGRQDVTCEKAALMVSRYLASQETQFEICDKFDVTEFTFLKYRSMVIEAINRTLLLKFFSWPKCK